MTLDGEVMPHYCHFIQSCLQSKCKSTLRSRHFFSFAFPSIPNTQIMEEGHQACIMPHHHIRVEAPITNHLTIFALHLEKYKTMQIFPS